MEKEMKTICSEFAKSIQRELDLEAVVRRLQERLQVSNKRSSECLLDSGYDSERVSEYDQRRGEIERTQRDCAVERASIRLELSAKLQDEKSKRIVLEEQIEKLTPQKHQFICTPTLSLDDKIRIEDLESICANLRRRLLEEKESNSNFQCLLSALQCELQEVCFERDKFRRNSSCKLNHNWKTLSVETRTCVSEKKQKIQERGRRLLPEFPGPNGHHFSISCPAGVGLLRAEASENFNAASDIDDDAMTAHLTRKELARLLKEVEVQRDALHSALRSLLNRQESRNRVNYRKQYYSEV